MYVCIPERRPPFLSLSPTQCLLRKEISNIINANNIVMKRRLPNCLYMYIHANVPSLVLKARHLGGSALCDFHRLGWL